MKQAPMRKTIYSLPALMKLCRAANRRYLEYLSSLDDPGDGLKRMAKLSNPTRSGGRSYRGFNLLSGEDQELFAALSRGEFNISGLTNRALRRVMPDRTSSQISRQLKRLRTHGVIKKVGRTYKYYVTRLGKAAVIAGLKLVDAVASPNLQYT